MSNVQSLISEFAPKFEAAVRSDALALITASIGGKSVPAAAVVQKKFAVSSTGVVTRKLLSVGVSRQPAKKASPGVKRTPEQIEKTAAEILAFLDKNPSSSAEQIKTALKVDLKTIELPIAKLLASKSIKKTGQKRATKYTAKA